MTMSRTAHLRIFIQAALAWVGLWLAGLPSYYQQYPTAFMAWFEIIVRKKPRERRVTVSLWIAFYFTVPVAIFDRLNCGVYMA